MMTTSALAPQIPVLHLPASHYNDKSCTKEWCLGHLHGDSEAGCSCQFAQKAILNQATQTTIFRWYNQIVHLRRVKMLLICLRSSVILIMFSTNKTIWLRLYIFPKSSLLLRSYYVYTNRNRRSRHAYSMAQLVATGTGGMKTRGNHSSNSSRGNTMTKW